MTRAGLDHYKAEPEVAATEALIARLPALAWGGLEPPAYNGRILEPCHGSGNITGVLRREIPGQLVITNDLDDAFEADHHVDACDWVLYGQRPAWIVTNPPFNVAPRLLPHFVKEARLGVAAILPINFLEPRPDRREFLERCPPTAVWSMLRVPWIPGTKQVAMHHVAWFVWTDTPLKAHPLAPIVFEAIR